MNRTWGLSEAVAARTQEIGVSGTTDEVQVPPIRIGLGAGMSITVDDPNAEEVWRPRNSGGGLSGPMRLREALVHSRNLVSIRILRDMGVKPVIEVPDADWAGVVDPQK